MNIHNTRKILGLAVFSAFLSLVDPRDAAASGFLVARFGGEKGHPTTDSPTAMYYNPAGLALGRGWRVYVEGILAYRKASYERPAGAIDNVLGTGETGTGTPAEAISANSGKATLLNPVAIPFAGVATDFGVPNLGVAVGFYVPFGGSAKFDRNDEYAGSTQYPGAVDGIARWWDIEGDIKAEYITAAGAWRWPSIGLSAGIGLNLVMQDIFTVRARNATGTDDLVTATGQVQEGRSVVDVSGVTFSVGAGVIWQPRDDVWVGLSYQSQPGFGKTGMDGTNRNKLGETAVSTGDITIEHSLPDVIRAGGRWRARHDVEARLFGEYVRWSHYETQCIRERDGVCSFNADGSLAADGSGVIANLPRNWHDAFGVRAGASWWQSQDLELFAGLGFDSSAIPDETLEPAFIDMNKISGALGAQYTFGRYTVMASYTQFIYLEKTTDRRPRDSSGDPITPQPPSRTPDSAGTYNQSVGAVNLGVEARF